LTEFRVLDVKKIQPNRLNPRLEFGKKGLDELSDSIKEKGLLQPIVVRPRGSYYEVVVGERRYRASQQAGLSEIPAVIHEYSDEEVIELNLVENIQRSDLSAVEKAKACSMLKERFPDKYRSWADVAASIGVDSDTVRNWVRTLELPEEVQTMVAPRERKRVPEGKVGYATALDAAKKIEERPRQVEVIKRIVEEQLPQAKAREVIRKAAEEPKKKVEEVVREVLTAPVQMSFRMNEVRPVLRGEKTQTSGHYTPDEMERLKPGSIIHASIYEPHFADLRVRNRTIKRLREFTDSDARMEGYVDLERYKEAWAEAHGSWDADDMVDIVQFDLLKRYPGVEGV
jgi:ParB family chromosome partitioning protein